MSSKPNLHKQIGCINGFFQIFDRHQLQGNAKKVAKEKQRASTESPKTSCSSSSRSSSFSSLECNRLTQPEPSSNSVISAKTVTKEEAQNHIFKHVDSPRPLQLHKPAKQRNSLSQAPCNSKEEKDGSLLWRRDVPRLSLDGRVSHGTFKPPKVKELPRLSLDSRQSSMRATTGELKSNNGMYVHNRNSNITPNPQQTSVVAKLMGLEAFPGDTPRKNQTGLIKPSPSPQREVQSISRSARTSGESKRNHMSGSRSPQSYRKDLISPGMRNSDSVNKYNPSSKTPIEPAPWRRGSGLKANTKSSNLSASVYGKIEKGLVDIELKKSGKDLRALERILEDMQKTAEMSESRTHNCSPDRRLTLPNLGSLQNSNSAIINGSNSPRSGDRKFQISTGNRKESVGNQSTKDQTQRGNPCHLHYADTRAQTTRPKQTLKVGIQVTRENATSSGKSPGTKSPRLQKKDGIVTKSCDSNTIRRQLSRQATELRSPGTKWVPKPPNSQQRNNKLRDVSKHGNAISKQSDSSTCLASHNKTEATSATSSDRDNRTFFQHYGQKQKNLEFKLKANRVVAEPVGVGLEQPSPISVLNATFYRDESPSSVKKITSFFKDDEARNSDEAEWTSLYLNQLWTSASNLRSDGDKNKSDNIQHLVSLMGQDESINYIAVLPEELNPEHSYIYKVLLASGLLRDLDSGMALGSLINPKVFLAVEQSISLSNGEHLNRNIPREKSVQKIQRKLIFDAVNETLGHKLVPKGCSKQWFSPNNKAGRIREGQQLLSELCSEIDQLQANKSSCRLDDEGDSLTSILWGDLMPQSTEWLDYPIEIFGLVVDIDSLIFRDLINEVVNGEAASLQTRSGGYCRQLFN